MQVDLFSFGHPLVDYTVKADEAFLKKYNLRKGGMTVIDNATFNGLEHEIGARAIKTSGGSATNVAAAFANLGSKALFCGSVGYDDNAKLYENELIIHGLMPQLIKCPGNTGVALTFITPDKERTFAVYYGVACAFKPDHFSEEQIKQAKYFHTTGYELESMQDTILHAFNKFSHGIISFDVADSMLIKRNKGFILNVLKENVNLLFANEEEARALTGKEPERAVMDLSDIVDIVVLKLGEKGAFVQKGNISMVVYPHTAGMIKNTNGAGDGFAGAFLHGLNSGLSLEKCGELGAYYAGHVICQDGARLGTRLDIKHLNPGNILK